MKTLLVILILPFAASAQNLYQFQQQPQPPSSVFIIPAPAQNNLERQLDFQLKQEAIRGQQLYNQQIESNIWKQYLAPPQGVEQNNAAPNPGGFEIIDGPIGK